MAFHMPCTNLAAPSAPDDEALLRKNAGSGVGSINLWGRRGGGGAARYVLEPTFRNLMDFQPCLTRAIARGAPGVQHSGT